MGQQKIHCSINNCHYWGEGNRCHAREIMVTSDSMGASLPDQLDALQASSVDAAPVESCMETCCKTFVEEGSENIDVDGITKI
ncbi:MAG: DUF1540 domain-containing protein [Firmicutes bacterium]|nr:DUF1540 domain-containing protein [Bacillota bacterium]